MIAVDPRTGQPFRRKPKRTRAERGRPSDRGPLWKPVRRRVMQRAGGMCEARMPKCGGAAHHVHHLLERTRGGPDMEDNLIAVCGRCHKAIHTHEEWAYRHGLLRRSGRQVRISYPGCPLSCRDDHMPTARP